ncbi:hypothetical protein D3C86_1126540 [compost metagenome]
MDEPLMNTTPRDNPAASRFELPLGDRLAIADYILTPGAIAFTHTEVPPEFQGRGLASKLIKFALDAARDRNLSVTPHCEAVASYIARHPGYQDLLEPAFRKP